MAGARLGRVVVAFWLGAGHCASPVSPVVSGCFLSTVMLFSMFLGPAGSIAGAGWGLLAVLLVPREVLIGIVKFVLGLERLFCGRVFWARFVQGVLKGRFLPRQDGS